MINFKPTSSPIDFTKIKFNVAIQAVRKFGDVTINGHKIIEVGEDSEYVRYEERFLGYVFLLLSEMIGDVMELVKLKYKEMLHIYLIYS